MRKLFIMKYNLMGKIFLLLFWSILGIPLGLFFLLGFTNYIGNLFGFFIIIFSIYSFLNLFLFDSLVFYDNYIVKNSSFFWIKYQRKLKFSRLSTIVNKSYIGGTLYFFEKENKRKTYWFFNFSLLPISNRSFLKIRQILINKKVIDGDFEWNY